MSQHDFTINNQTASNARSDINSALQALASNNSGTAAPTTTFANMLWYETDTNRLYMRNEANTAWLNLGYIDQTGGLEILDNTPVVTTAGAQTGILGDQTTATWQAGTGTTQSLVSPANVKAAILALQSDYVPPTTAGDVGTYAFLVLNGAAIYFGTNYSGSSLVKSGSNAIQSLTALNTAYNANATGISRGSGAVSGTWKCMGEVSTSAASTYGRATLFLRIS